MSNFLLGIKILEEAYSPINRKIVVIRDLAWGTYIQVEGLTQSGGVVYDVWKQTLKKVKTNTPKIKSVLILGLGGGSAGLLTRKNWPDAKITGVDIDPVMVGLGRKYLKLREVKISIEITDAEKFVDLSKKNKQNFDLILVDLYVGDIFPVKFENEKFLLTVGNLLSKDGIAIFNRLYFGEKRSQAVKFGQKLEKIFPKVEAFYPQANIMFICK